jgi:Fe-S oxidoreductase
VQHAIDTGARYLVTACPFCIVCLEDSIKITAANDIEVLDVSELAEISARGA